MSLIAIFNQIYFIPSTDITEDKQMSEASDKKDWRERAKSWILRFVKFNIIGIAVFLVGTVIYGAAFPVLGEWTWVVASAFGGFLQFVLLNYFNKKKKGVIFQQCNNKG
ncbi:MAG TPA: hypothetical protein VLU95_00730 [Candidatus Acidoferrum sp.]|nr:hypothetical protein [Candidatus Acidoferrum sp.]